MHVFSAISFIWLAQFILLDFIARNYFSGEEIKMMRLYIRMREVNSLYTRKI
jgi:hypothetical protein